MLLGGLGGGGLASLASIRASQIAARTSLADKLHQLARTIVSARNAVDEGDVARLRTEMEVAWNDFATHQRILCPSHRIEILADFMRRVMREGSADRDEILVLAGQVHTLIARIVGMYSAHMFRVWAWGKESEAIDKWLNSPDMQRINPQMRERLQQLLR